MKYIFVSKIACIKAEWHFLFKRNRRNHGKVDCKPVFMHLIRIFTCLTQQPSIALGEEQIYKDQTSPYEKCVEKITWEKW